MEAEDTRRSTRGNSSVAVPSEYRRIRQSISVGQSLADRQRDRRGGQGEAGGGAGGERGFDRIEPSFLPGLPN